MDIEVAISVRRGDDELMEMLNKEGRIRGGRVALQRSTVPIMLLTPKVSKNLDLLDQEIYLAEHIFVNSAAGHLLTFPKFGNLPEELQNKIFKLHLPGPRIVDVATEYNAKRNFLKVKFGVHPVATALLHVNNRARDLARKTYTICFQARRRNPIYFSWARDTLYFNSAKALLEFSGQLPGARSGVPEWIKTWQNHIQHLTFEHKEWDLAPGTGNTTRIGRLITNMPSLKTIMVTIDTWKFEKIPTHAESLTSSPHTVEKVILEGWMRKWKTQQEVERYLEELEIRQKLKEIWVYTIPSASASERLEVFLWQCAEAMRLEEFLDAQVKVQRPKVIYERKGVMWLKANAGYMALNKAESWKRWIQLSFAPVKAPQSYNSPWFGLR